MSRNKQRVRVAVSFAATAFFLWLALRNVDWAEVALHVREANYFLLAAAVACTTLGVHIRAMRWKSLLAPVHPDVRFHPRMAGTAVGLAANNLLPARMGEFARVLVCARMTRLKLSAVFATLVMERVLDGLVCIGILFAVMAMPSFPAGDVGGMDPRSAARVLALAMVVVGGTAVGMALFPHRAARVLEWIANRVLPRSFRRPVVDALHAFLGGLGVLRDPRLLAISVGWVLFQWFFLAASYYLAFLAFGIDAPGYAGALFLQSVVTIAVSIPSAPGFFGPFEAAAVYGLALWDVEKSRAASFAIGFHLGGFLSVTLLGLWYAWRLNLTWAELRGSEEVVEEDVERDDSLAGADARGRERA